MSDNGLTAGCDITVRDVTFAESIKIDHGQAGSSARAPAVKLKLTLDPPDADETITWTTDDATVATVDPRGQRERQGPGRRGHHRHHRARHFRPPPRSTWSTRGRKSPPFSWPSRVRGAVRGQRVERWITSWSPRTPRIPPSPGPAPIRAWPTSTTSGLSGGRKAGQGHAGRHRLQRRHRRRLQRDRQGRGADHFPQPGLA